MNAKLKPCIGGRPNHRWRRRARFVAGNRTPTWHQWCRDCERWASELREGAE